MLLAQNASLKNKAYHGTPFVISRDRSFALIHVANREHPLSLTRACPPVTLQRRRFQVALLSGALASAADATATSSLMVRSLRRPIQKAPRPRLADSLFNLTHTGYLRYYPGYRPGMMPGTNKCGMILFSSLRPYFNRGHE